MVAGCVDGTITVFDLMASGKERLVKPIVSLQGKKNVRCLQWRERPRREIIAGHADGLVTVWDYKQQSPIFVLQAHTSAITAMKWDEDRQTLMTCAKDKSFKIWQFPLIWVDEQSVDLQRAPEASVVAKAKKAASSAAASGAATAVDMNDDSDDSDDDGLGRIRSKPKKEALPAGLGSMFSMSNPLAVKPKAAAAEEEEEKKRPKVDISKGLHGGSSTSQAASTEPNDDEEENKEEESKKS